MSVDTIREVVMVLVPMVLALSVHEYSHARVAFWLGDRTAKSMGRLTLNPLAHVDPIGTLLLPIITVVTGSNFFIGWAKPVPVNPVSFSRRFSMRKGMMITAAAGPASNIVFALASIVAFGLCLRFGMTYEHALLQLLVRLIQINFVLAIFNLIPLPPLDGGKILSGFAGQGILRGLDYLERNPLIAFVGLIVLLNTGVLGAIIRPPMMFLLGIADVLIKLIAGA